MRLSSKMLVPLLFGAAVAAAGPTLVERDNSPVAVSLDVPSTAGAKVLHPFVSFSIELAFFPDFAGIYSPLVVYIGRKGYILS